MLGVLFVLLLLLVLYKVYKFYSSLSDYPPGPLPLPFIGNLHQIDWTQPHVTFAKWGEEYGGIYTLHIPTPNVMLTSEEAVREALVKHGDAFKGRSHSYMARFFGQGDGLVLGDGALWAERRRFALRTLKDLGVGRPKVEQIIVDNAERIAAEMQEKCETGEPLDPEASLDTAVSNVIFNVLFGYSVSEQKIQEMQRHLDFSIECFTDWKTRLWEGMPWIIHVPLFGHFNHDTMADVRGKVNAIIGELIDEYRANRGEAQFQSEEPDNFLECYLRQMETERADAGEEKVFTEHDLLVTMNDLVIAGSETTVTTLKWSLIYLAKAPHVQRRCTEELQRAVYQQGRHVAMALRSHVPYFVATVTELQRLANIVPVVPQHRVNNDVTLMGHTLRKDTLVIPQIANVLCDPVLFPQPDKFEPERFVDGDGTGNENGGANQANNVISFSLGKRACAGEALARAELFLILAQLLLRYTFELGTEPKDMVGKMWATRQPHHYTLVIKRA